MPVLIGAALIATAILLSALISIVGTRFIGMDSPNEDSVWLIDRLTGSVYRCQAAEHGKAACDPDTQIARVMARDSTSDADARLRLAAQLPIAAKAARADYVIATDGSFADTDAQVRAVHEGLMAAAGS